MKIIETFEEARTYRNEKLENYDTDEARAAKDKKEYGRLHPVYKLPGFRNSIPDLNQNFAKAAGKNLRIMYS